MIPHRLVLAVFFSATILCGAAQQWPNFCAQARQMHNECLGYETAAISGPEGVGRVGRPGPRGPPGLVGKPGMVNYTAIDEEMKKKFEEMELKFEEKLQELVRYEEKINRTWLEHQQKTSEMYSKIDAKILEIASYEENLNKTSLNLAELRKNYSLLHPKSCQDLLDVGDWVKTSGISNVYVNLTEIQVYCDLENDGGGWTVFQRRMDGSVNFNRNWDDYVRGFGNKNGEFWLGLEALHLMTKDGEYELRVELTDKAGATAHAKYGSFSIAGSEDNYRLTVGQYSGTAGDSLAYHANGMFSAPDRDHDTWSNNNCAADMKGGWWFKSCQRSHLNGEYSGTGASTPRGGGRDGLEWYDWRPLQSLKATEMKFRKKLI